MAMQEKTNATIYLHLYGPSNFHCDQEGDRATISIGPGSNVTITASMANFLLLADTCKDAAVRIAKKLAEVNQVKTTEEIEWDDAKGSTP